VYGYVVGFDQSHFNLVHLGLIKQWHPYNEGKNA